MRGILAGVGAREALERGGDGEVVASFREACYLTLRGAQVVLVGPAVHPGPVHLVLDTDPPRLQPGSSVRAIGSELVVDGVRIDLIGTAPWDGSLPEPAEVREQAGTIATTALGGSAGSALLKEPFEDPASQARALLEAGRLEEAADRLGGLGPGLTPSGDDALAGIVFGLRAVWGPGIAPLTVRATGSIARGSLGRAFVWHAALGQALAPVHDLVTAGAGGDPAAAARAARVVGAVGETSGRDLLLGLAWALSGHAAYRVAVWEGPVAVGDAATPRE